MRIRDIASCTLALIAATIPIAASSAAATVAISSSRLEVAPGVHLHLLEGGDPTQRSPLILIPGWSAGADIWNEQIDAFATSRRVIALDPRSQGDSTTTTNGNTPETRAEDLHAIIKRRRLARPVLVAWSQGVQDAAAYVAKYGSEALAGIVLVDSTISQGARSICSPPANAAMTFERLALYQNRQEEYLRGMFRAIISKPQRDGAIDRLVATALKTPPTVGAAMLVADLYGEDRSSALHAIKVPVLVIAAANSPELDAQRAMAAQIPGARFEIVDDASHAVFLDQPERFRALLGAFLADIQ